MIKLMHKKFYITGEISFNGYFLVLLPKAIFRTQPKVYGGAFFAKLVDEF